MVRQHPMVLRPRLPKITNLTASLASFVNPISRVLSSPTYESITFYNADRYAVWHSAMKCEIQALHSNDTWSLVSFHHLMNVIGSRWVYKIKCRANGSTEHYKASLVARGFNQQEGIEYSKTSSHVIKQTTIRLVFSIVVSCVWKINKLNIHNAFLNGTLDEEVYMQQPLGFINSTLSSHVCRLHKSLYGLKQAP